MSSEKDLPISHATERAKDTEWADLPQPEIQALIARSRSLGWRKALEPLDEQAPVFAMRMRTLGLSDWHLLLCNSPHARTLDIGCGFGSSVLGLGSYYEQSLGVEFLPNRLEYAHLRAQQEHRNKSFFVRGDGHKLPVRDSSCQLVSLNGVLEWAAHYKDGGDPSELQKSMLIEAKRTLTADGHLAIAIENRFALETLAGFRDTHTDLPYVPALPRAIADSLSRWRAGEPYRTYLYSHWAYRKLLKRAGFPEIGVLDLAPSYNNYRFIVDTRDTASYRFLAAHGLLASFFSRVSSRRSTIGRYLPQLLGYMSYAYLLLAGRSVKTLLDSTHPLWERLREEGVAPGAGRFACRGDHTGQLTIVVHSGNTVTALVRVGRELSEQRSGCTDLPAELRTVLPSTFRMSTVVQTGPLSCHVFSPR